MIGSKTEQDASATERLHAQSISIYLVQDVSSTREPVAASFAVDDNPLRIEYAMGQRQSTGRCNQLLLTICCQVAAIERRLWRVVEVQVGSVIEKQVDIVQRRELPDHSARVNIEFYNAVVRESHENMVIIHPDGISCFSIRRAGDNASALPQLPDGVDDLVLCEEMEKDIFSIG